jgi:hypothetical protein
MALDWEPLATAKPGYEREFESLFKKLLTAKPSMRAQVMEWMATVSSPPYATIGAPRVGFDAEADEWLRDQLEKADRLGELEKKRVEMRGYNVLELMPPCDGFPVYSNHVNSEELDRYSFHAELLADVKDELGAELCELAYTMMLPQQHKEFAAALFDVAHKFAADHALPRHVATVREPVYPKGTQERRGHVLFAAAKWCTYWAMRGHGLAVTY